MFFIAQIKALSHFSVISIWYNKVIMTRILLVEDDKSMAKTLIKGLSRKDYDVSVIEDGNLAKLSKVSDYDLVLLDWMLPGTEGIDILKVWREDKHFTTPVIMLTAKQTVKDRVDGLKTGADDYISKIFEWEELYARIEANLRRSGIANNLLTLDQKENVFKENGKEISLSPREFEILKIFYQHPNRVLSRNQILENLYDDEVDSNVIEKHIYNIRKKFTHDPIQTIRGVGYKFKSGK